MNDETDLLRGFHSDVPQASARAWEKSRAAIAAEAMAEQRHSRLRRPVRSLLPVLASAAAVMILVAGALLLHGLGTSGTHTRPPAAGGGSGQWRAIGLLTTGSDAPQPMWMTCATTSVCYAAGSGQFVLYVSQDGAHTWSAITEPSTMTITSSLTCWAAQSCAAGATSDGSPAVGFTSDGGRTWSFTPLPAADGKIFTLDCWGTGACHGLASATRVSVFGYSSNAKFLTISGDQVTARGFAADAQMQNLACPTPGHCVAEGATFVPVTSTGKNAEALPGTVQVSSDGGMTWHQAAVPHGFRLADTGYALTCPSARVCLANSGTSVVIASADGGLTWRASYRGPRGGPQIDGIDCPAERICQAWGAWPHPATAGRTNWTATALTSVDGGTTWTTRTFTAPASLPAGVPRAAYAALNDVDCPAPSFCAGLGEPVARSAATPVFTFRP